MNNLLHIEKRRFFNFDLIWSPIEPASAPHSRRECNWRAAGCGCQSEHYKCDLVLVVSSRLSLTSKQAYRPREVQILPCSVKMGPWAVRSLIRRSWEWAPRGSFGLMVEMGLVGSLWRSIEPIVLEVGNPETRKRAWNATALH